VTGVLAIAAYGFREGLRRKVFAVVLFLTAGFLAILWVACHYTFKNLTNLDGQTHGFIDSRSFVGSTLLGLCMFGTLFLGTVLSIFLTLGVVNGDAERGLLQPLVVRPIGRATLLLSRFLGAAAVAVVYVFGVYAIGLVIIDSTGSWLPADALLPAIELAGAVVIVVAVSILGSVVLSSIANGIAVFMLFGAGLVSGFLGFIGHSLHSDTVERIATISAWVLPFEALYQDALHVVSTGASGLTEAIIQLGPFGGSYVHGWDVRLWSIGYLAAALGLAIFAFSRKDL
jgi:ABC-type transport system involved in multi-copper enzyme maturation permease subunit